MTWQERSERLHARLAPWDVQSPEAWRYLTLALCGEAGELANLVAHEWRGEPIAPERVAGELADVAIYLHLLARALHVDLDLACDAKADENERRFGGAAEQRALFGEGERA